MPNKNGKNTSDNISSHESERKSQNRNTSYYKLQVKKDNVSKKYGYNFLDRSKTRQTNSYIRAVALVIGMLIIFGGLILLGMYLNKMISQYNAEKDLSDSMIKKETNSNTENINTGNLPSSNINPSDELHSGQPEVDISQIYNNFNGVYLDISALENTQHLKDFIADIKNKGINAVMIDIKRDDGIVPYDSSVSTVLTTGAAMPNVNIPMQEIIMTLRDEDIYISGIIACFKDSITATTYPTWTLINANSGLRWEDSTGNNWINPYTELVREYIKSLAVEAVSIGINEVILDYFFFPNLSNPADIDYNDGGVSKYSIIYDFVSSVKIATQEASLKSKLGINIPIGYFLDVPNEITGINPMELLPVCDFITTNFSPADVPTSVEIYGKKIIKPESSMYNTIDALCNHFSSYLGINKMFRPMIQAFSTKETEIDSVKINEQKKALSDHNIHVWTLINQENNYNFD